MKKYRDSGTYILVLQVLSDTKVNVGSLGLIALERGYYFYVGSGKAGVSSRVKRHFAKRKNIYWHIDYITSSKKVIPLGYFYIPLIIEELLAIELSKRLKFINGFGSSDSRAQSHLFYCKEFKDGLLAIKRTLYSIFKKLHRR